MAYRTLNPFTEQLGEDYPDHTDAAVEAALAKADGAPPHREIVVAWRAGSSRAAEARLLAEALKLD